MRHAVVISDMHCGHLFGVTPPDYWMAESEDYEQLKIRQWQTTIWGWLKSKGQKIGHIDHLIVNGDAIDGRGERSGGVELITTDRNKQVQMAYDTINLFDFSKITIIRGTDYHVGQEENYEDVLADKLGVRTQDHAWLEHNGCIIDFKHHIGSTSIPGAVPASLAREAIWNMLWAEHKMQPKANVYIRSHLHHWYLIQDDDITAIITPALQGWTRYGGQRLSKTISIGFLEILIGDKGEFQWVHHRLIPQFAAAKVESM